MTFMSEISKAFDQQQADLLAKEGVLQAHHLINFGGVALGIAVITLMGAGDSSVDPSALQDYRDQTQRNINNSVDREREYQMQRDRDNAAAQRRDWEELNRLMNLDIQRNQQNYQQNHQ